jgi:hypothetical protein
LNIVTASNTASGVRGRDRSNLSTATLLWSYTAAGSMIGLASKSTTTWFLGGRSSIAQFYKFHFEVANTVQLTYTSSGNDNSGLAWYINTAYIISASGAGSVC